MSDVFSTFLSCVTPSLATVTLEIEKIIVSLMEDGKNENLRKFATFHKNEHTDCVAEGL